MGPSVPDFKNVHFGINIHVCSNKLELIITSNNLKIDVHIFASLGLIKSDSRLSPLSEVFDLSSALHFSARLFDKLVIYHETRSRFVQM